jgi:hypothetical protein
MELSALTRELQYVYIAGTQEIYPRLPIRLNRFPTCKARAMQRIQTNLETVDCLERRLENG